MNRPKMNAVIHGDIKMTAFMHKDDGRYLERHKLHEDGAVVISGTMNCMKMMNVLHEELNYPKLTAVIYEELKNQNTMAIIYEELKCPKKRDVIY